MANKTPLITVREFEQIAIQTDNRGRKLQLVHGVIVEERAGLAQARISSRLILWLGKFLEQHPFGEIFNELRIDLPDEPLNARVPDICVVIYRADALAQLGDNDPLPFMPNLIAEIQSEGQTDRYMSDLAAYYFAHGCQMVWLVYPDRKLVEWLTTAEHRILTSDDAISGGAVLPGLSIAVEDLFAS